MSIFWPFSVPAPASTVLSATPCTASDETATGAGVRCNVTDGAVRSGRAGRTSAECAVARRRSELKTLIGAPRRAEIAQTTAADGHAALARAGRAPADTGRVCVRARPARARARRVRGAARRVRRLVREIAWAAATRSARIRAVDDLPLRPRLRARVGQAAVYEHCARPAVTSLFDGFNSTVMAYGQTGAGKTFTVEGEGHVERAGILPRAARDIFALTSGYNFDRPSASPCARRFGDIPGAPHRPARAGRRRAAGGRPRDPRGPSARPLRRGPLGVGGASPADIAELAHRGGVYRHTAATEANASSSRSHAVFVIVVEQFSDGVATGGSV